MELKYDPNAKPLTEAEIYKFIPKQFVIACHTIHVYVDDWLPAEDIKSDSEYGHWHDVKLEIRLARAIKCRDGEVVPLNEEQIRNTFWHEMFHCFCFFGQIPQDESMVQALANCMREFETSKK